MTYIFSVKPEIFEKIKPLLEENRVLNAKWDITEEKEKRLELIKKQQTNEAQILKILEESGEKYEYLEGEELEPQMLWGFEEYFEKVQSICASGEIATPPEKMKEYWRGIETFLKNEDTKNQAIEYVVKERGYNKEPMSDVFDRWIALIKHVAENGNWYYFHVD